MAAKNVARADGYYTKGQGQFKLRKGSRLPKVYDDIFYIDEPEERVSVADTQRKKIAESTADNRAETTSEGEAEEQAADTKPARQGKAK